MGRFFVTRPIFAIVVSVLMTIVGMISYFQLPIEQYPEIAPPSIVVQASYPGADAETIANTVATPLEQEINGIEGMLYLSSYSTADGSMSLTITFELGTDLDTAQVLVQNRVAIAEPRLPQEVRALGVTTTKSSPDLMMVVHMLSPDESFDQLYVSNYARARVRDRLVRIDGVGNLLIFGEREFSARVWLDPDKLTSLGLTAGDVVNALREQNVQVSGGSLGAPPNAADNAFQVSITTQGRLEDPREFGRVIVKASDDGRVVRVRDVARIEIGARSYVTNSYLDNKPAVALGVFQRPGSNALATAAEIRATMDDLAEDFPTGLEYRVVYNPTEFISASIDAVYTTLFEAVLLVVIVILVFLQSWRTAIIPLLAVPVSLIGTFAVMLALGYTLNLLTLFGLILAIGIVVDDAIVVVENVERNIQDGLSPREASARTMDEVQSAIIGTSLVLIAVFVPAALVPGITGQFYKQFAVTIAVATVISSINSLSLSPALAAVLLKPHDAKPSRNPLAPVADFFARGFNRGFDAMTWGYTALVRILVGTWGMIAVVFLAFIALMGTAWWVNEQVPTGFIPDADQGYAIVVVQLPEGASLDRTDAVMKQATEIALDTPGVTNAVAFAGFSGATFTNASNQGVIFTTFAPFEERLESGLGADAIVGQIFGRMQAIREAFIIAIAPPAVSGVGTGGGFKLQLQDTESADMTRVLNTAYAIMGASQQSDKVIGVFTTFSASSPQIFLEIDRVRAQMLNVPIGEIFETLSINLGSAYVNDFNAFGRLFQVRAQADQQFRLEEEDIRTLRVRTATGELVPLGTLVSVVDTAGPALVQRYNQLVSVPIQGNAAPGVSTGDALIAMEELAEQLMPPGVNYEWTELALQERNQGNTATYIFAFSVLFAFLFLAALYESWVLPLAIILVVPLAVLSALSGVMLRGMDNNILTQVGLIVLVGLSAKNAILIVEFAKQAQEERGLTPAAAAVDACRLRLRPILMTAFAFILGVVPLMIATGPGAEMRQALGTAVFFGMSGVTFLGLFFTPVFYVALRRIFPMRSAEGETAPKPT
ncbi:multidrug efflux RND transporter permease subunit [Tateyamaria omphalii]|uniref:efflux RND transporter permease subunit n=1 Tax=Tateyamaria omphalii TaxID=299262 RepID=UPI001C9A289F|nr:multidrug efflux RND transporter permease subunit [Tateyamaria omphalii]MBY5935245.1 multidrug efflux RND transporter permease subunit [Tateyamaria omphalii]